MKTLFFWLLWPLAGSICTLSLGAPIYLTGEDHFNFVYSLTIPKLQKGEVGTLWIPIAISDGFQSVELLNKTLPEGAKETLDPKFHNKAWVINFDPASQGKQLSLEYKVQRKEKEAYPNQETQLTFYLEPDNLVPLDSRFKKLAANITKSKQSDLDKGHAIYDYVLSLMKYDKSGTGWGRGDAIYACDAKKGNCTDFHSLFIAIARSAKIPSRFMIGFTIPADKEQGAIEGYHCWAEFLADGKWIPIDISEAAKNPSAKDYYFGHHPANRFQFTQGRDLLFSTPTHEGPINFLIHPYTEINGKQVKISSNYSFKRILKQ